VIEGTFDVPDQKKYFGFLCGTDRRALATLGGISTETNTPVLVWYSFSTEQSPCTVCNVSASLPAVTPKRPKVEPIHNPTLFEMGKLDAAERIADSLNVERPYSAPGLLLGTSSFTADGWQGSFYPPGMQTRNFLSYYATQFKTVEIDSTYYGTPSASTVMNWYDRTSPDFIFAAKVPQVVTHDKVLKDCEAEFDEFVDRMGLLNEKLGPLLLQFPFFNKYEIQPDEFSHRLRFFLMRLKDLTTCRFVVEIRNRAWLDKRLTDLLREHNVALALTDLSMMPRPWELKDGFELVTADFVYVRWLGDRRGIEALTTTWDKTVIDRTDDLRNWAALFRQLLTRDLKIFAYANNHYSGYGPGTVKLFWDTFSGQR
jgi:uncharacterized protein YecE (DUF72 family)